MIKRILSFALVVVTSLLLWIYIEQYYSEQPLTFSGGMTEDIVRSHDSFANSLPLSTSQEAHIALTGDIMLGRNVESLMRKYNEGYPFEKVGEQLGVFDFLIGNLEGPIVSRHVQTPDHSTSFSFAQGNAALMASVGFDALSQANNHGYDRGPSGDLETTKFLTDAKIIPFGDGRRVTLEDSCKSTHVKGYNLILCGFNDVFGILDKADAVKVLSDVRRSNPTTILISYIHWGDEYKLYSNKRQQELAHAFIDVGVDAVIGHHPHVLQELEIYKGKFIAYSLGNFVFDQYFSQDVQTSLVLDMKINGLKEFEYILYTVAIERSQPRILGGGEAEEALKQLAKRSSDTSLQQQISSGRISDFSSP